MSQQFAGVLATVGPFAGTSTFVINAPATMARAIVWTHGAFGVSVTSSVAGGTAGVAVWSNVAGVSIKLAELTGLMGLSRLVLPLVNEATGLVVGATQSSMTGILSPVSVIATGVSTGVGITFGCVVTAALYRL